MRILNNNVEIFQSEYWVNGDELYLDYSQVPEGINPEESGCGWFFWFCFPGCLPESHPFGPFNTEEKAIKNAEETFGEED